MKKTNKKQTVKATKNTAKAKVTKAVKVKKAEAEVIEPVKKITLKSIVMNEVPKLLKSKKNGMKYSEIISAIQVLRPEATRNSVHGCLYSLKLNEWKGIFIAAKGKYNYNTTKKS